MTGEQRRLAAIMFTDMVGSTEIAEKEKVDSSYVSRMVNEGGVVSTGIDGAVDCATEVDTLPAISLTQA
jgi:class 3 adenylate cyclase